MNKVDTAVARAISILRQYDIGWDAKITNARRTLAVTDHGTKTIELSKRFVMVSTLEEFDGIMHHEVSHVLAGPGKAHGGEFVSICQEINPNEVYSCDNYPIRIGLYKYTCPNCGVLGSNEKRKEMACANCLSNGMGVVDVEVIKNKIEVTEWASIP